MDLFVKENTPDAVVEEINEVMSTVLSYNISILSLPDWNSIFKNLNLSTWQINDFYDNIFIRKISFWEGIKQMSKLIYHILTNKRIRKKILPTIPLARKMLNKKGGFQRYLGHHIFIGRKS